jgi:hypothetical protein
MPRSLLLYQDGGEILKAKTRKDLLEELSTARRTRGLRCLQMPVQHGQHCLLMHLRHFILIGD